MPKKLSENQKKNLFKPGKAKTGGRTKGTKNNKTYVKETMKLILGESIDDLPTGFMKMAQELYNGTTSWDNKKQIFEIIGRTLPKSISVDSSNKTTVKEESVQKRIYQIQLLLNILPAK